MHSPSLTISLTFTWQQHPGQSSEEREVLYLASVHSGMIVVDWFCFNPMHILCSMPGWHLSGQNVDPCRTMNHEVVFAPE